MNDYTDKIKQLDPEARRVTQEGETETPFTGKYWKEHSQGMYQCVVCGQELFSSTAKFDSGTGWPSFEEPTNLKHVEIRVDRSLGMERAEVICKRCGAHLGHVFDDGPTKTGKRFCINSCALDLKKQNTNAS